MNVYDRVVKRLEEFEFEPTDRRVSQVYFSVMSGQLLSYNYPTDDEIDAMIQDLFNFRRVANTELAQIVIDEDEVIQYTDKWIYIKDF
jgi:hypothetical protein